MGVSNFSVFTAFKAKDGVTPVFKNMTSASDRASTKFRTGMEKAKNAVLTFKKAAVGTVAAITAIGTAAIVPYKAFSDWEKGIKTVYTLLSKDELSIYGAKLKDASKNAIALGINVEDANKALFDAVSAFGMNDKTLDIYNQSLILAKAGNAELSTALGGVVSVVNAWGAKTTDVTAVANAFFTAQKNGVTTVSELASAIGEVAPMAKAMGISLEETMASMAALTKGGLSTDAATTALRATLTALAKPSTEAAETLESFGVPVGITQVKAAGLTKTLQKLIELQKKSPDAITKAIPNVRALTGVLAMDEEKMQEVHKTLGMIQTDIKNGTGLNEALEMMNSTSAVQWARLMGAFKDQLINIGEAVAPYINPLLQSLREIMPVLSNLVIPAINATAQAITVLCNIIKYTWIPIISLLIGIKGMQGVKAAFIAAKAAIAWYNAEVWIAGSNGLVAMSKFAKLKFIIGGITTATWASVRAITAQTLALLANPWTWVAVGIGIVVAGLILAIKHWDKVKEVGGKCITAIIQGIKGLWQGIKTTIGIIGNFIKEHFVDVLLLALGPVGMIISALKNMPALIKNIKNGGKDIELKTKGDGKNPASNPKIKDNPQKGKIGVDVNVTNDTEMKAEVSTSLESSNSLELKPA